MRSSHHVTGLKAAIGTAGLVAGVMLGGGIIGEPGPAPQATGTAASSQPSAPGPVTSSRIVPVPGVFARQPPPAGLMAIVIPDPPPGNPPGPRAIAAADISGAGADASTVVITDNGGDGPGPKAALIPGGGPSSL